MRTLEHEKTHEQKQKPLLRTSRFVSEGALASVHPGSWVNPAFLFGYAGKAVLLPGRALGFCRLLQSEGSCGQAITVIHIVKPFDEC